MDGQSSHHLLLRGDVPNRLCFCDHRRDRVQLALDGVRREYVGTLAVVEFLHLLGFGPARPYDLPRYYTRSKRDNGL